jgi:hypothetical protein
MKALLMVMVVCMCQLATAQTPEEFLKQKATQRKYLLQQLAALRMYASYLKQGYEIANKGLNKIKGFTNGEFNLHEVFFESLKAINPAIIDNQKVTEIYRWQRGIINAFKSANQSKLSPSERSYFADVKSRLLRECGYDIDDLLLVITSNHLEMTDDERIARIEKIHASMSDKYQFSKSFTNGIKVLGIQRAQEEQNLEASKLLLNQIK